MERFSRLAKTSRSAFSWASQRMRSVSCFGI
jgi:hypothetical protein